MCVGTISFEQATYKMQHCAREYTIKFIRFNILVDQNFVQYFTPTRHTTGYFGAMYNVREERSIKLEHMSIGVHFYGLVENSTFMSHLSTGVLCGNWWLRFFL